MNTKTLALGAAFMASVSLAPAAFSVDNSFGAQPLAAGYTLADATDAKDAAKDAKEKHDGKHKEGACGDKKKEGACGGTKGKEGACGGKGKEGACGTPAK